MGTRGQASKSHLPTLPPPAHPFLVDFENKKNEFLICGRLASMKLFQEGRLEEANRVCDAVLGVDPEDIDTHDLKEQVQYFIAHPNKLDLSKLQAVDIGNAANGSTSVTNRRLLRSVSDRRPSRRMARQWNFDTKNKSTNSNGNTTLNESGNVETETNDEVFEMGETTSSNSVKRRGGLQRSQSESSKPPVSVLQQIKRFEEQARSSDRNSGTQSSPVATIKGESKEGSTSSISSIGQSQIISVKADLKKKLSNGHSSLPCIPKSKSSDKDNVVTKSTDVSTTATVTKEKIFPNAFSKASITDGNDSTKVFIPPEVIWTQLGENVNKDLRDELEKEFFKSALLTSSCWANFDGDILGYSRGCRPTKKEIQAIVAGMQKREYITSSKVILGGTRYSCLSATGHVFRARVGKLGINCTTFKRTVVVCFYSHPVLPKPVGKLVLHIEKFLSDFGY